MIKSSLIYGKRRTSSPEDSYELLNRYIFRQGILKFTENYTGGHP